MNSLIIKALYHPGMDSSVRISTIILAGGRGSRMDGQDKGLLQLGDHSLIEHVLARVQPHSDSIIISCNRNLAHYQRLGHPAVVDANKEFLGPLAGIQAAGRLCQHPLVFVCPCDMPNLPLELIPRLYRALDTCTARMAICHDGQRRQNLLMLMRRECLDGLGAYLDSGGRRVQGWQNQFDPIEVDFSDRADSLGNLNDPEQLNSALAELPAAKSKKPHQN